jgi:hypothetical protein
LLLIWILDSCPGFLAVADKIGRPLVSFIL